MPKRPSSPVDQSPPEDEGRDSDEVVASTVRRRESTDASEKSLTESALAKLPEASSGVVTGVSSSRPPPRGSDSDLPNLAPPRREGDTSPPEAGVIDADAIDINLEALLAEERRESNRPRAPDQLPAICLFGRYEILGRLAFGGMAEIFLGRERSGGLGASRLLVVKRILPHIADEERFVEMFLNEARLAIQLNHPNICHIYEFGELDGSYFIAMEWINGVPFGKLMQRGRKKKALTPEVTARITAQVAAALHHAHRARDGLRQEMRIVHRDVSPNNIMVGYDGQVKLLDFGIAKATAQASKTEAGIVKGKFSYMSPEQCTGRPLDGRSDVFSLGVCFYEALTFKRLYRRETQYETMDAVIHEAPPSIRDVDPDLPPELDEICKKALQKNPDDRFASAGEFQAALDGWLARAGKVVNADTITDLMEGLYAEQIQRGPLVDASGFRDSFESISTSQASAARAAEAPQPAPSRPWWMLISAGLLAALVAALVVSAISGDQDEVVSPEGDTATEPAAPEPEELPVPVVEEPVVEAPVAGSARVVSTPPGASVRIGEEEAAGVTPFEVADLAPGTHQVVLSLPGFEPWQGEIEVAAGEVAVVTAELARRERRPRPPAAPPGQLSINTRPWSNVYVGGRHLGTTPIAGVSVPSGTVRLRLVDRDGNVHHETVRVEAGGSASVSFNLAD